MPGKITAEADSSAALSIVIGMLFTNANATIKEVKKELIRRTSGLGRGARMALEFEEIKITGLEISVPKPPANDTSRR